MVDFAEESDTVPLSVDPTQNMQNILDEAVERLSSNLDLFQQKKDALKDVLVSRDEEMQSLQKECKKLRKQLKDIVEQEAKVHETIRVVQAQIV